MVGSEATLDGLRSGDEESSRVGSKPITRTLFFGDIISTSDAYHRDAATAAGGCQGGR